MAISMPFNSVRFSFKLLATLDQINSEKKIQAENFIECNCVGGENFTGVFGLLICSNSILKQCSLHLAHGVYTF